jgi:hypothetical protein
VTRSSPSQTDEGARNAAVQEGINARRCSGRAHFGGRLREHWPRGVQCYRGFKCVSLEKGFLSQSTNHTNGYPKNAGRCPKKHKSNNQSGSLFFAQLMSGTGPAGSSSHRPLGFGSRAAFVCHRTAAGEALAISIPGRRIRHFQERMPTARGIPAVRGGKWSAVQVSRLLARLPSPFEASVAAVVQRNGEARGDMVQLWNRPLISNMDTANRLPAAYRRPGVGDNLRRQ